uniref:Uracil phosphoribosyltransferase n=1 Tax=Gracilaria tenuistipitata var. liui TaxID=285951 RepID=Q6B916_GRATL|nr:uracil phosphoribosyltransferase [Gracilaria tenuistipitata var. liui]AAT79619.1 uracil phosphoribosyltransferase [Gracilaria tenuistipitata var. liui]
MQLNIHILTHPIIRKLAYEITYKNSYEEPVHTDSEKILGMLIFYEISRNWVKIDNLYIKKVDIFKEDYVSNQLDKYLIITNIIECHNILTDINKILPKTYLRHIDLYSTNNQVKYYTKQQEYKIIIFEKFLKNYNIIETINYLQRKDKINLNNIKIVCITCDDNFLKYLAQKYPTLNVYTTKII